MMASVSFGDSVRISHSPETEAKGLAGLQGVVYGETTPSITNVEVVGSCTTDYAINVYFEALKESFWFPSGLVEFVDHGAGQEISLKGIPKKWVRSETGAWAAQKVRRPWWRFW